MKRIAITCGDPSGLGPELIQACLGEKSYGEAEFHLFGAEPWLSEISKKTKNEVVCHSLGARDFTPGSPEPEGARLAIAAMEAAAKHCLGGASDAVVTGPISKELCVKQGFSFPGQTEFFASRWGGEPTMAFVGDRLKLCLATWHIPLKEVSAALDETTFKHAVKSAVQLGALAGISNPRILVCGLNPHAGENGLIGNEEHDTLIPWLAELKTEIPQLEGPVPGDTAFARAMKGEADVVVAMYHDQGLAPFKAVDFDSGVNVTLGLKRLRVSPDHGTGFGIAGKGIASSGSMRRAIELCLK